MKKIMMLLFSLFSITAYAQEIKTVDYVDLNRYLGTWYEIASYPQWFQKGCSNVTANYSLRKNGDVRVLNTCVRKDKNNKLKQAVGVAKIVDKNSNSKLKVSFFGPFYGKYWIIDLGQNYEFAVVSDPTKETLWILSREKVLSETVLDGIFERLEYQGYDLAKLQFMDHN